MRQACDTGSARRTTQVHGVPRRSCSRVGTGGSRLISSNIALLVQMTPYTEESLVGFTSSHQAGRRWKSTTKGPRKYNQLELMKPGIARHGLGRGRTAWPNETEGQANYLRAQWPR